MNAYTDPGQHLFWIASRALGAVALVMVGDLAGVLALHAADGTVAEGCAFPVAPYRGSGGDPGRKTTAGRSAERRR